MRACFYKGTKPGLIGVAERLTRFWTRGPYSHMELNFSDGLCGSSVYTDGGVRVKRILLPDADWDFVTLPDSLEAAARAWFVAHNGEPYDIFADMRFAFGFLPPSKNRWMCVEACLTSLGFEQAYRFEPTGAQDILQRLVVQS